MNRFIDEQRRNFDNMSKTLEQLFPEDFRSLYPRMYQAPPPVCGSFYSVKCAAHFMHLAVRVFMNAEEERRDLAPDEGKYLQVALTWSLHLWVSDGLSQALMQTIPPQVIDWVSLPFPHPSMFFLLPKGSLRHSIDGDVRCFGYARVDNAKITFSETLQIVALMENGVMRYITLSDRDKRLNNLKLSELDDLEAAIASKRTLQSGTSWDVEDQRIESELIRLMFNILFVMLDRPELISISRREGVVRKRGVQKEFWSPGILGEKYRVRPAASPAKGGEHSSPRFHWVRGYYKLQAHGPHHSERKLIWIEPFTRGDG